MVRATLRMRLRRSGIKRFIAGGGVENLENLFELQIADIKGGIVPERHYEVIEFRNNVYDVLDKAEPLSVLDLYINGHDLQKIGIQPVKERGFILNALLDVVLENPDLNDKAVCLILSGIEICYRTSKPGGKPAACDDCLIITTTSITADSYNLICLLPAPFIQTAKQLAYIGFTDTSGR